MSYKIISCKTGLEVKNISEEITGWYYLLFMLSHVILFVIKYFFIDVLYLNAILLRVMLFTYHTIHDCFIVCYRVPWNVSYTRIWSCLEFVPRVVLGDKWSTTLYLEDYTIIVCSLCYICLIIMSSSTTMSLMNFSWHEAIPLNRVR